MNETATYTLTEDEVLIIRFGLHIIKLMEEVVTPEAILLATATDAMLVLQQDLASL